MIETIDIIKANEFIVDAHERDDGYIEAVFCNNHTDEQLFMYEACLDKNDEPVMRSGVIPPVEMYRWDRKTRTWFHSSKTLNLYKKNKKNDEDEPALPPIS